MQKLFWKSKKGMTLVELLVAIAIMLIVMQGFTYLLVKSWDNNKSIIETGLASTTASRAVNRTVIQLRAIKQADNGDYPIELANNFDLTIYTDVDDDGVTERVHYFLDLATDQFKQGVTDPNTASTPVTYPNGDTTVTVLARYITNENSEPVFSYYNDDYPGDTVNNPLATPASLGDIQLIKVKMKVNIDPVHAPENIFIESFVDLRNLHGV